MADDPTYLDGFESAERERRAGRADKALESYFKAYSIGGSRDADIEQQIAVCYGMKKQPQEMRRWIYKRLDRETDPVRRGEALRDAGKAECDAGFPELADELFDESLERLPSDTVPGMRGATYGLMARCKLAQGDLATAKRYVDTAVELCRRGDNRHYLLYRLLDAATIKSLAGKARESREYAQEARRLAREAVPGSYPAETYGGPVHLWRASALGVPVVGGYRLEGLVRMAYPRLVGLTTSRLARSAERFVPAKIKYLVHNLRA